MSQFSEVFISELIKQAASRSGTQTILNKLAYGLPPTPPAADAAGQAGKAGTTGVAGPKGNLFAFRTSAATPGGSAGAAATDFGRMMGANAIASAVRAKTTVSHGNTALEAQSGQSS